MHFLNMPVVTRPSVSQVYILIVGGKPDLTLKASLRKSELGQPVRCRIHRPSAY
jgi:hypothetical protein